jgi:hypothetical protein
VSVERPIALFALHAEGRVRAVPGGHGDILDSHQRVRGQTAWHDILRLI